MSFTKFLMKESKMNTSNVITDALNHIGIDTVSSERAPAWERKEERLLVGTVERATLENKEGNNNIHICLSRHDGKSVMVFHTTQLTYLLCNLIGQKRSDLTAESVSSLNGKSLLIYCKGQDQNRNDMYEYHVAGLGADDDVRSRLADIYKAVVSSGIDLSSLGNDGGQDSDI